MQSQTASEISGRADVAENIVTRDRKNRSWHGVQTRVCDSWSSLRISQWISKCFSVLQTFVYTIRFQRWFIQISKPQNVEVLTFCTHFGLEQVVKEPTRITNSTATLLDLIITDSASICKNITHHWVIMPLFYYNVVYINQKWCHELFIGVIFLN